MTSYCTSRTMTSHSDSMPNFFQKHETDGKALLLLKSDITMKYMGLKLGLALKICNIIAKIQGGRMRRHGALT